jgi:tryptophanyl-tRNA synthetase
MTKKVLLSGVKPTGRPHIGNYFGAMKQFVDLQNSGEYEPLVFVADYHALNFIQNGNEMREHTAGLVLDYLGIGLDPKVTTLFKQSEVPAHTELAWIFDTITTMSYLERGHAYKDAREKNKEISVGSFNYPMLMAADILLYDPDIVPVGQDQKQHVEFARDAGEKFNRLFGDTFKIPEPMILGDVAVVPGTDGRKMSKSYGNTIPLFGTRDEIIKAVMSIVTDSSGERPEHVYAIHKLLKPESELHELYESSKGKYKVLKDALVEDLDLFIKPLRDRRESLASDPEMVSRTLSAGAEVAREKSEAKMVKVRHAIGVA